MHPEDENKFKKIINRVHKVSGLDVRGYRESTLKRRLERRLLATQSRSYKEYLAFLKKDPSECHKFLDSLSINVTDFFRDKTVFLALKRKILPPMIEKALSEQRKRIRVWSVACSGGQEPYSLAITLNEIIENQGKDLKFKILATDLNELVLKKARTARYTKKEIKNVPKRYLDKYFVRIDKNEFEIKENIRKLIKVRKHDLISGEMKGKFHLILCRNLLIFLTPGLQSKVLKKMHASLKKEGILVLGTAETPRDENLFKCLSPRDHIFQKMT
jgi:chemotaxis protein methyltransferase CheR